MSDGVPEVSAREMPRESRTGDTSGNPVHTCNHTPYGATGATGATGEGACSHTSKRFFLTESLSYMSLLSAPVHMHALGSQGSDEKKHSRPWLGVCVCTHDCAFAKHAWRGCGHHRHRARLGAGVVIIGTGRGLVQVWVLGGYWVLGGAYSPSVAATPTAADSTLATREVAASLEGKAVVVAAARLKVHGRAWVRESQARADQLS